MSVVECACNAFRLSVQGSVKKRNFGLSLRPVAATVFSFLFATRKGTGRRVVVSSQAAERVKLRLANENGAPGGD